MKNGVCGQELLVHDRSFIYHDLCLVKRFFLPVALKTYSKIRYL